MVSSQGIWASSPMVLNDTSEVDYGLGVLQSVWWEMLGAGLAGVNEDYVAPSLPPFEPGMLHSSAFIASASKRADSLGQWVHYAGPGGFSVGLNAATSLGNPATGFGIDWKPSDAWAWGWHEVIYDRSEQEEIALDVLRLVGSSAPAGWRKGDEVLSPLKAIVRSLPLLFKDAAFKEEEEVRFLASVEPGSTPKFRASGQRLIPYVDIKADTSRYDDTSEDSLRHPLIRGVNVGPGSRPGTDRVVESLLAANRIEGATVSVSKIPYLATSS